MLNQLTKTNADYYERSAELFNQMERLNFPIALMV